jgi:hypothetical protein
MKELQLSLEERSLGYTHKFVIGFADLVALGAVLSGAVVLAPYVPGQACVKAAFKLNTPFDGGATSTMVLDVGHNGATTDDPDSLLDNYVVHLDGTEVLFGLGNGAAFATLSTGYVPLDSGNYEATFTATGGNLNALTTGEVTILLGIVDLNSF